MAGQSRKPPPNVIKAEAIDNLLDIYAWNMRMFAKSGDGSYRERLAEVEALLMYYSQR